MSQLVAANKPLRKCNFFNDSCIRRGIGIAIHIWQLKKVDCNTKKTPRSTVAGTENTKDGGGGYDRGGNLTKAHDIN